MRCRSRSISMGRWHYAAVPWQSRCGVPIGPVQTHDAAVQTIPTGTRTVFRVRNSDRFCPRAERDEALERGGLEIVLPDAGDRGFESIPLQRRVHCEPDFLGAWGCPSAARLRVSGVIARSPRKGQHFFETAADLATTNRADTGKHRGQNRRGSTTREIAPPKPSRRIPSVAERRPSHRTQGLIRLTAR